jgi:hypothetical protein
MHAGRGRPAGRGPQIQERVALAGALLMGDATALFTK